MFLNQAIQFQESIFNGDFPNKNGQIKSISLFGNTIIHAIGIRPLMIHKYVEICSKYDYEYIKYILEHGITIIPAFIYFLFEKGLIPFDDIVETLIDKHELHPSIYFYDRIPDYQRFIADFSLNGDKKELALLDKTGELFELINYGFKQNSIEYSLKFDDIEKLEYIFSDPTINSNSKPEWSAFEWAFEPPELSVLSFSGFFGSIKCFKYLFLKGYTISNKVIDSIICGGSHEMFHIANNTSLLSTESKIAALKFYRNDFVNWIIEFGIQEPVFNENNLMSVQSMIKNPCLINNKDPNGNTILHYASQKGYLSLVKYLVINGADVNIYNRIWFSLFLIILN